MIIDINNYYFYLLTYLFIQKFNNEDLLKKDIIQVVIILNSYDFRRDIVYHAVIVKIYKLHFVFLTIQKESHIKLSFLNRVLLFYHSFLKSKDDVPQQLLCFLQIFTISLLELNGQFLHQYWQLLSQLKLFYYFSKKPCKCKVVVSLQLISLNLLFIYLTLLFLPSLPQGDII